jgi:hypothetical protein
MLATVIISSIAILFAWLARFQNSKYGGLEVAFILLTIFMSIRFNFGNDYSGYVDIFLRIGRYSNFDSSSENLEVGWYFLCWIFQPIGFFGMIIVLTIFEYTVIYRLIKKYVPKDWYWFSVFIFTFNTAHMLIFGSMMRQFLAMCIFILAVDFIIERRWIIAVLLILLASSVHSSALVLLPFSFLGYLNLSLTEKKATIWLSVYLLFYFAAVELVGDYLFNLLALEQFEKYDVYLGGEKGGAASGFGVMFNIILYAFLLFHQKHQSKNIKTLFLLFAISVFFYVFAEIAPMIGRLGYYFSVFSIICYPFLFKVIKNSLFKYSLMIVYIIVIFKSDIDFFDPNGIYYKSFYNYQTIFSAPTWM